MPSTTRKHYACDGERYNRETMQTDSGSVNHNRVKVLFMYTVLDRTMCSVCLFSHMFDCWACVFDGT